jgi:hypothetical protein
MCDSFQRIVPSTYDGVQLFSLGYLIVESEQDMCMNDYHYEKNLGFSTMVLTMFQLHFELENITSNCKMFLSTQNDGFNCLPK